METLIPIAIMVLMAFLWIRIMAKTGHNQWLGLLILIPLVNLGLLVWLAFTEWPVERRAGVGASDVGSTRPGD